jgi:hypothetical protein
VVNRGKAPLNNLNHVTQYQCDRHEPMKMAALLPDIKFDAVIDRSVHLYQYKLRIRSRHYDP